MKMGDEYYVDEIIGGKGQYEFQNTSLKLKKSYGGKKYTARIFHKPSGLSMYHQLTTSYRKEEVARSNNNDANDIMKKIKKSIYKILCK